jgi:hypothetical protein
MPLFKGLEGLRRQLDYPHIPNISDALTAIRRYFLLPTLSVHEYGEGRCLHTNRFSLNRSKIEE